MDCVSGTAWACSRRHWVKRWVVPGSGCESLVSFRCVLHSGFVWNGDADMCVHGSFLFVCVNVCSVCVCVCVCVHVCVLVRIKLVGHAE